MLPSSHAGLLKRCSWLVLLRSVVRAARACIEAYYSRPLSISDVAGAVGVHTRTLQIAFERRLGISPKQYLTGIRIDAMRHRLIRHEPGTTVTSAALDSGIFHIGRGISAYRRRHGESPAVTLRRASK